MKYSEDILTKLKDFMDEMDSTPSSFWKHCSVHHIADLLGVHRDTIYDWEENHPEFSDTIKKWRERRNALFLELKQKNAAWIFLAKNWLGMRDKQEVEHSGELKPLKVIVSDGDK
ncbi:MAG: hypothetical protein GTN43_00720 [Candidatus Aenigmarchaeota archaeon]|nr:hypothetical protein [Candidatus Aenigmarchaeota archaeon]